MRHWIFVIRADESVFKKRIEQKKWPIFHATKFRVFLEICDNVIFYKAGEGGQKFMGTAVLKSQATPIPDKVDYYVDMEKIDIWKNHPSIRNLIPDLGFIKNKDHWGLYVQGGVLRIEKNDYSTILKAAKKLERKK